MTVVQIGIFIIALLILQGLGMWFMFGRKKNDVAVPGSDAMFLLQKQVQDLAQTLDARVAQSSQQMHESMRTQLGESSKMQNLLKDITQEVTSVKEIGRQTQTFAQELKNLQDILKNPKQRGILGEYYLETVLKNVLPPGMYQIQYPFKNGEIVDAAVFINDKIVPIDSKFSLDNYNRFIHAEGAERVTLEKAFVNDLKLRITETAKYIRPEENTMDFAFMFIPSEGIYYDLLTNQVGAGEEENLIQRAAGKYKVIIVSPTSFLAYLQTVMQGLKALEIEKRAEEIQKKVGELVKHIDSTNTFYQKLGGALGTVVSHYNAGHKELAKIDKDVYRITGDKAGVEPELLDKPVLEIED
jgi:DNA recombination protein RmuC